MKSFAVLDLNISHLTITPPKLDASRSLPNWVVVPLYSAVLLVPCFWQSRIQSADLASHIYNAWLASQIHRGPVAGLWISPQRTNVLFDDMLEWSLVRLSPDWAQRIAVSICVLIFGWGMVQFLFRVSRTNWWFTGPCVAMLAYGFVFHLGLFNFYLSLGICLCYLSLTWASPHWERYILGSPLLLLAWTAHPLPVLWAIATAAYAVVASRISPRRKIVVPAVAAAGLVSLRFFLTYRFPYNWSFAQVFYALGANQIVLFGWKYALPFTALLVIWAVSLRTLIKRDGALRVISSIPFQLCLLNALAVVLIPRSVMLPEFARPLNYITERLSLLTAVMVCAVLGAAGMNHLIKAALVSTAILFFAFVYLDQRDLNTMEDRLDAALSRLPAGARVIGNLSSPSLRSLCLYHQMDRACVEHCYSYANYEPSSRQFRVRAAAKNGIVLNDTADVDAVAEGRYVAQSRDLPAYLICECGQNLNLICSRPLKAGELNKTWH